MKVLFVAYYFEPYPGVGSKRISYWAKHLNEISPDIQVDVITATEGAVQIPNGKVIYIEKKGTGLWTKLFKTNSGASWGYDIKKWLLKNAWQYDIVLFTGGPFLHFRLAFWIKRYTTAKIVFDFRDPMSVNPRMITRKLPLIIKNRIMRLIERFFVSKADAIISVNESCFSLIKGTFNKKKYIIDNGFDEKILQQVKLEQKNVLLQTEKIRFVYAGKFSKDRDPIQFIDIINSNINLRNKIELIHIGEQSGFLQPYRDQNWILEFGKKTYHETLKILQVCDYGLIFTIGHPFESTTKIFDYIGMGLNITIVANKIPLDGALMEYSKIYPHIKWIKNDQNQLKNYLNNNIYKLKENRNVNFEFSRKTGLIKLSTALKEIAG